MYWEGTRFNLEDNDPPVSSEDAAADISKVAAAAEIDKLVKKVA